MVLCGFTIILVVIGQSFSRLHIGQMHTRQRKSIERNDVLRVDKVMTGNGGTRNNWSRNIKLDVHKGILYD